MNVGLFFFGKEVIIMNLSINGIGGGILGGINKNSAQYKAAAKDYLSDHRMEVAKMSPEEKLVYETFGGEDAYMRNVMRQYDSNGNYISPTGVAGMLGNGIPETQRHQIISISESSREDMYKETLRHFKLENGIANGDTTKRSDVYRRYQLSVPIEDRMKGSWTLQQYEQAYESAMVDACKATDPSWSLGKPIPAGALDDISRESIEASLKQSGNRLIRIDESI